MLSDQLMEQCPCSLCVQLQQVLPSWVFEHRTSIAHAHPGHLVGSQEVTHESILHDVWASQSEGMGSKRGTFAQSTKLWCCGAGKSYC